MVVGSPRHVRCVSDVVFVDRMGSGSDPLWFEFIADDFACEAKLFDEGKFPCAREGIKDGISV